MIKLFSEQRVDAIFNVYDKSIVQAVNQIPENQLSGDGINLIIARIVASHQLTVPVVEYDKMDNTTDIENRLAVVTYSIPYTGKEELLICRSTRHADWTYHADIKNNIITFRVNTQYALIDLSAEWIREVKRVKNIITDKLKENLIILNADCTAYNAGIQGKIERLIEERNNLITKREEQKRKLN